MSVEINSKYRLTNTNLLLVGDKFVYNKYLYMVVSKIKQDNKEMQINAVVVDRLTGSIMSSSVDVERLNYYNLGLGFTKFNKDNVSCIKDMSNLEVIEVKRMFIKLDLNREELI